MFGESLISAEQHWAIWAILFIVSSIGLWSETTKWGARVSGFIISISLTFLLANFSIIPSSAKAYDIVWSYLVPLAIPLLLFKANLKKIIREAGPMLIVFIFGAIGTVIGTIVAFNLIPLGLEGWKLAGIFCATYVGGSMNYVAVAQSLQLNSSDLLTAGIAADNLIMTLYFMLLFLLPSIPYLQKFYSNNRRTNLNDDELSEKIQAQILANDNLINMTKSLSIAFTVCAVGFALADISGLNGSGILFITAIMIILASVFPKALSKLNEAEKLGAMLMQIFFSTIGASANIGIVIKVGPVLFLFAALILTIHLITILIAGKLFKINIAEIVIASNANMGGPTTAAAMAVARKWNALVIPAILCGTLGYAIANFVGVGVAYFLK